MSSPGDGGAAQSLRDALALDGATINCSLVAEELWADGPSSGKVR